MKTSFHIIILLCLSLTCLVPGQLAASDNVWSSSDHAQARIFVSEKDINGRVKAALHLRMSPGWHSYWRSPGEAGLPPRLDWSASPEISNIQILYPVPKRFDELGLTTFGYDRDVMFPLDMQVSQDAMINKVLNADLHILVCKDICIPQKLSLSIDMRQDQLSQQKSMVDMIWRGFPLTEKIGGLSIQNIVLGSRAIVLDVYSARGFDRFDVFVELPAYALIEAPEIKRKGNEKEAQIILKSPSDIDNFYEELSGQMLRFTITNGRDHIEKTMQF